MPIKKIKDQPRVQNAREKCIDILKTPEPSHRRRSAFLQIDRYTFVGAGFSVKLISFLIETN